LCKYVGNGLNGNIGKLLQKYIKFEQDGDVFLHLAAKSNGSYEEIVKSNINYLIETINYCKKNSIKNFVFFSAISIYNKDNLYSVSKKMGEKILEESGLNVLALRLPMVLTKDKENGILNRIRKKLINNENVILYNADKKFNNFISVEEIADFIIKYRFDKQYEIIDIATDSDLTLLEIVKFMKSELNSNSNIEIGKNNGYMPVNLAKAKEYGFKSLDTKQIIKDWLKWK